MTMIQNMRVDDVDLQVLRTKTRQGNVLEIKFDGEARSVLLLSEGLKLHNIFNSKDFNDPAYLGEPDLTVLNTCQYFTYLLHNNVTIELRFTNDDDGNRDSLRILYGSARLYVNRDLSIRYTEV